MEEAARFENYCLGATTDERIDEGLRLLATPDYLAILTQLVKDVREHDDKLNNAEIPPTGDDYNELWGMVERAARLAGLEREG